MVIPAHESPQRQEEVQRKGKENEHEKKKSLYLTESHHAADTLVKSAFWLTEK